MSIREKIVNLFINYGLSISIVIGGFSYLSLVNNMSFVELSLITLICLLLILWTTVDRVHDKIPNQPTSYFLLGFFLTQLLTFKYIQSNYNPVTAMESYFVLIFVLIAGFVIWQVSIMFITGFLLSTTDISFSDTQNINDPYGDKHAERILNETEE